MKTKEQVSDTDTKHTQGELKLSGPLMTSDKTKIHEENVHCQFLDSTFAATKPILVFGETKDRAIANAKRVEKTWNMHNEFVKLAKLTQEMMRKWEGSSQNSFNKYAFIDVDILSAKLLKESEQK